MSRILALDYGSKRVGLALSDVGRVIASPYKTVEYRSPDDLVHQLVPLIESLQVAVVVVGLPLGMRGQKTAQTSKVEEFVSTLQDHISIPIRLVDERLSTVEASRVLSEQGRKPSRNRGLIDERAAAIFLQTYLDRQSCP